MRSLEAARFLVNRTSVVHLSPFMGREYSLAEAAHDLEISKSRMSYWLNKLLKLELIQLVRVEKRGRHNVPVYRAVADAFIVPLELIPLEADNSMLEAHRQEFDERTKESLLNAARLSFDDWHVRFSLQDGKSRIDVLPNDGDMDAVKLVNEWGRVRLTEAQAKAFRQELMALVKHYWKASSTEGRFHLYRLLLVEEIPD